MQTDIVTVSSAKPRKDAAIQTESKQLLNDFAQTDLNFISSSKPVKDDNNLKEAYLSVKNQLKRTSNFTAAAAVTTTATKSNKTILDTFDQEFDMNTEFNNNNNNNSNKSKFQLNFATLGHAAKPKNATNETFKNRKLLYSVADCDLDDFLLENRDNSESRENKGNLKDRIFVLFVYNFFAF